MDAKTPEAGKPDAKKPVRGYSGPYRSQNDYYRDGAHILMFIVKLEAVFMSVLTIALTIFLCTRHNHDRYFAETFEGKTMEMFSRPVPNMSMSAMLDWAATAASEVMTFGFNNIDVRFAETQKLFTPEGWTSFRKAMIVSKLYEDIINTQQLATAVPRTPPIPTGQGVGPNGKYQWKIDVPLLITFRAGSDQKQIPKTVHLVIETMPTAENPSGVGISQWEIN